MSHIAVWNAVMDEHNYLTRRWQDFCGPVEKPLSVSTPPIKGREYAHAPLGPVTDPECFP